ncbi:MAG TPA: phosphate-starvation-inducible PsiE family protein [Mycobacteriales bacterium]|jgi:uncharacterized membrane protein (DUF373 family)|nr:phosphate-starvation-inducible PsiE family protein [Mycobacteriales bacterium]
MAEQPKRGSDGGGGTPAGDGDSVGDTAARAVRPEKDDGGGKASAESRPPLAVNAMLRASDLMHMVLAVGLLALAAAVLARAAYESFEGEHAFYERALAVLNSLLFVLILLEVFRMALAHFDHKRFSVGPFVVIGIISVLRHVITGGAELAVQEEHGETLRDGLLELSINGVLVVLLVIALVVVHRSGIDNTNPESEQILPGE